MVMSVDETGAKQNEKRNVLLKKYIKNKDKR